MVEAVLDIKQWGNILGVRLPAAVARAAHLYAINVFAYQWKMGAS